MALRFVFSLALLYAPSAFALFGSNAVVAKTSDQTDCLPGVVRTVLKDVAAKFGTVQVVSVYRSPKNNRRRGGASQSQHMQCKAADFLVPSRGSRAVQRQLLKFMAEEEAKYHTRFNVYCTGRSHVDNNNRGLPDSYSSCVEKETWRAGKAKSYRRTHTRRTRR